MALNILTVPGYQGSGEQHWQTWLEREFPQARRVTGIDWEAPVLHTWAVQILRAVDEAPEPSLIIAHSFGCLASALAIARRPKRVVGAILVAPADPRRFNLLGTRGEGASHPLGVAPLLPQVSLGMPGYLIGSENDPWLEFDQAKGLAARWKMGFINAGAVGHINVDSGHGRWPWIHALTYAFHQRLNRFHAVGSRPSQARIAG